MHPYVLLRDQLPKSKGQKSQAFSFWIFTPGIALESWKILSGNFLFLELKNPGKFCPGRKLSWNFLKIIYIFPGIYSSGIFHSWNFPLLEFCPGTFCSWNLISRNFLVTPGTYGVNSPLSFKHLGWTSNVPKFEGNHSMSKIHWVLIVLLWHCWFFAKLERGNETNAGPPRRQRHIFQAVALYPQ